MEEATRLARRMMGRPLCRWTFDRLGKVWERSSLETRKSGRERMPSLPPGS